MKGSARPAAPACSDLAMELAFPEFPLLVLERSSRLEVCEPDKAAPPRNSPCAWCRERDQDRSALMDPADPQPLVKELEQISLFDFDRLAAAKRYPASGCTSPAA